MPKFFVSVRSIVGDAFVDGFASLALGKIRYLIVPDDQLPKPSHAVGLRDWVRQIMQTFHKDAASKIQGNLLFLVHGFNEGSSDVDSQHRKIINGLAGKFDSTVVSFDWPSWTDTFAYLPQLDVAKRTAIDLVNAGIRPLLAAQTADCQVAVHALCHSMGAYVVREALDHADDGTVTSADWTLNQLVLIAGDVAASDFVPDNQDTQSMLRHCYRLTNYFNKYDQVLQVSNAKRAGVEPRVGRVGLPPNAPDKAVNVDCSAHFQTIRHDTGDIRAGASWSHSWYYDDPKFMADLAHTLVGSVDRTVVPGRMLDPDSRTLSLAV